MWWSCLDEEKQLSGTKESKKTGSVQFSKIVFDLPSEATWWVSIFFSSFKYVVMGSSAWSHTVETFWLIYMYLLLFEM